MRAVHPDWLVLKKGAYDGWAEARALRWLDDWLEHGWEIHPQVRVLGRRMDALLLHPEQGAWVVEVKHIDPSKYERVGRALRSRKVEATRALGRPLKEERAVNQPVDQLRSYVELVRRFLGVSTGTADWMRSGPVGGMLLFTHPGASWLTIEALVGLPGEGLLLLGVEELATDRPPRMARWLPEDWRQRLLPDIRQMIVDGALPLVDEPPVELDRDQRAVMGRQERYLLVSGTAGSGKSLVLATVAAEAARHGEDVLLLCYNIALICHLRRMVARQLGAEREGVGSVQVLWFHEWMRWLYESRDWRGWHTEHPSRWPVERAPGELAKLLKEVPLQDDERFDCVLVDEGQDLRPQWIGMIKRVMREGGRLRIAGDTTQRTVDGGLDRRHAESLGLATATLAQSYRVHDSLIGALAELEPRLAADRAVMLPEQVPFAFGQLRTYWMRVRGDLDRALLALLPRLGTLAAGKKVAWADVAILFEKAETGERFVGEYADALGTVQHVFDPDHHPRRTRKHREGERYSRRWFGSDPEALRVSTIDSFKGSEARMVVVVLEHHDPPRLYLGLTRVAQSPSASLLVVLSRKEQREVLPSRPFAENSLSDF